MPSATGKAPGKIAVIVGLSIDHPGWRSAVTEPLGSLVRRSARNAFRLAVADGWRTTASRLDLAVALVEDRTMRRLNHDFRGRKKPTNVLSFAALDGGKPIPAKPFHLGDIALARGVIVAEARKQGKTVNDHLCHLVVHGVLHLLGYDHETEADAARMETLERVALAGMGIADPYAVRR
jgi:probable rRNA maturation factor